MVSLNINNTKYHILFHLILIKYKWKFENKIIFSEQLLKHIVIWCKLWLDDDTNF